MAVGRRPSLGQALSGSKSPITSAHGESPSAQGYFILGLLLVFAALSWASLAWPRPDAGMDMNETATMGLSAAPFLLLWVVMMVAMMFPTAAPMILTFHKIQSRKTGHGAFLATWVFVADICCSGR